MDANSQPSFMGIRSPSRPLPPDTDSIKDRLAWAVENEHFPVPESWALALVRDFTDRLGGDRTPFYKLRLACHATNYPLSFRGVLADDIIATLYRGTPDRVVRGIAEARARGWI